MTPYELGKLLSLLTKYDGISYSEMRQLLPSLLEETEFEDEEEWSVGIVENIHLMSMIFVLSVEKVILI